MRLTPLLARVGVAGVLTCASLTTSAADPAADPVAERVAGFKASKKASVQIREAIERGNHAAVAQAAGAMAAFAGKVPELFPPGSKGGFFSAAKDGIWTNFTDFQEKAKAFETQARGLERVATTEPVDQGALLSAYSRLSATCTQCHQSYKRGF